MAQYSIAVNNARLDAIETVVGASPKLRIYTGSAPANCAAAATGTLLVEIQLPSDWLAAASATSKIKAGTWSATSASAGTAGYYRIVDNAGTTCGIQGVVGATASGLEMILNNIVIGAAQVVTVDTYVINAANV